MIHDRLVVCTNCHLPIEPGVELVRVDTAELARRRRAAHAGWSIAENAPVRYRHATYEACSAAEAEAARWD